MSSTGMCHGKDPPPLPFCPAQDPSFLACQSKPLPVDHVDKKKVKVTRESRSPATAKLSPGMGIGRDAD